MKNNIINHFEPFLEKRNELLDGLAYQLLWLLTQPEAELTETVLSEFPWDMSLIGPLLETAESLLQKLVFQPVIPFMVKMRSPYPRRSMSAPRLSTHDSRQHRFVQKNNT